MAARKSPTGASNKRDSVDYSGMDPEMAETLKGETKRVEDNKKVYAPGTAAAQGIGKAESFIDKIKGAFKPKKKK